MKTTISKLEAKVAAIEDAKQAKQVRCVSDCEFW